ncbi:DUF1259 domain-containing protein [Streptomyces sp. NPDC059740]|uniref:DUF1259 domain-containing protein n=1 Tax=Streptomyces sp. NPDC059740 TaxID=3346926 RepID=UPI00365EDEE1
MSAARGTKLRACALLLIAALSACSTTPSAVPARHSGDHVTAQAQGATASAGLPVSEMEHILQADGDVSDGVLAVDIARSDIHAKGGPDAVPFQEGFQLQHELYFQATGSGHAILNGDVALRQQEVQPVIDALVAHHLVFQAEHQHLYDLRPMVWFVHFRGSGDPLRLARDIHAVIGKTATALPQHTPKRPRTALPAGQLGRVLGGKAEVGEHGIVTVTVPRTDAVRLGGQRIRPELGVSTEIQFQPLGGGRAVAVPDFSMTSAEVQPVTSVMRRAGWEVGCLYNQETGEDPQLYFAHMIRSGDPIALAHAVRAGLDRTRAVRPS